jgi:hypothetical protein
VYAAALDAVPETKAAADRVRGERAWRRRYQNYIADLVVASLEQGPEATLAIARAGLAALHEKMVFIEKEGGAERPLADAFRTAPGKTAPLHTFTIVGNDAKKGPSGELVVPYHGTKLSGAALVAKIDAWVDYGVIEPDTGAALRAMATNKGSMDLRGKTFVLLGAGSAMGPCPLLLAAGATVIGVDLDRAPIWARLIAMARNSPGTLILPTKEKLSASASDEEIAAVAGGNLLSDAPTIARWLALVEPTTDVTIGSYVYLDGAMFVQVSLACDAIIAYCIKHRRGKVALAFLCTPTDVHVVPHDARIAAQSNYAEWSFANLVVAPIRMLSSKMLVKNAQAPVTDKQGHAFSYVDALVNAQGPNYALAKRLQHWRAIVARNDDGCVISSNIAPSTSTASVVSNRSFAWAYDGMPFFKPVEIFHQESSNAVMTALLVNDLTNPKSAANPAVPLNNPYELFAAHGFHGGAWRCAYKFGTIGEVSVLVHFAKVLLPYIIAAILVALFWN